jgi:hypothetical protein
MSLEFISGLVVVLLGLIAGAFGIGHARGTSKAEAKAEQQRTEENAAATVAAAERKADVTKEASDVQQTVSHMRDDDVDRELRENLPAPVVVDTACNWVRIIYLTDHDIDVMDKQTKRDILAHNKSVQANCPQSTDRVTR